MVARTTETPIPAINVKMAIGMNERAVEIFTILNFKSRTSEDFIKIRNKKMEKMAMMPTLNPEIAMIWDVPV
jgi:hypothetical protein